MTASNAMEDMYRQSIEDHLRIIAAFPATFQSAQLLSEVLSESENLFTNVKLKSSVAECLHSLRCISRISAELDLLTTK